jgi:hypothetical protein
MSQDLIVTLSKRVKRVEKMMVQMMDILRANPPGGGQVAVKQEHNNTTGETENGINVMRIPS